VLRFNVITTNVQISYPTMIYSKIIFTLALVILLTYGKVRTGVVLETGEIDAKFNLRAESIVLL
jgi:hypothetical protein